MPTAKKRSHPPRISARSRSKRPRYEESPEPEASHLEDDEETINQEDICSICALLLVKPFTTNCKHTFCEDCFKTWADVSLNDRMELGLDINEDFAHRPRVIEAKCPMCRTLSLGVVDDARAEMLADLYPKTYAARIEETNTVNEDDDGALIEPMEVLIGNEHQSIRVDDDEHNNKHSWRFFVKFSQNDIVEEVHVSFESPLTVDHAPTSGPDTTSSRIQGTSHRTEPCSLYHS